ncbi:MAG TPA: carboxypeptidase regulatory-like domain-containing protein [Terracidiphilus sp.]|nr:carboxypeptidase regulatory-like domain-containing protein [Terracidiphilus sp.]
MLRFRNWKQWLATTALFTSAVTVAFGQSAQLSGKVSDPSGAVISRAEITITDTDNGATRRIVTNGDGLYAAPSLQPGHYRLVAHGQGFRPLIRDGLTLQVNDNIELDLKLEVGAASELVTVTGATPLLRTDDAETGEVIDNRRIEELPQYDRNVLAFAHLAPAVSGDAESPQTEEGGQESDYRIGGGRTTGSEFYIDGIPVTEGYSKNLPPSIPSPEAVQEFKVVSSGLSAEYGRLSGGVVTIITRSGSNQFHGSAYEFVKNQLFDANDYFSNLYGKPKGVFHNNIFGGSIGGPVLLPKVYNGHDKSFFFLNYEGNRQNSTSNLATANVPTPAERNGDFSQSTVEYNGTIVPVRIYDPTTGVIQPDGTIARQQFSYNGVLNVIPPGRLDAIAKIYSSYYPLPNKSAVGTNHANNYVGTALNESRNDRWTGRFDQVWSARNFTYFTITAYDDFNGSPAWLGPMGISNSGTQVAKAAALHHVFTLNPTTVVEGYIGAIRDTGPDDGSLGAVGYSSISPSIDYTKFGFGSSVGAILGAGGGKAPDLYTQGDVSDLGGGGGALTFETDFHAGVSLQKLMGRHNFKAGFDGHRYYTNQYTGGSLGFTSGTDATQYNPTNYDGSGTQYATMMLGIIDGGSGNQWAGPASLQTAYGLYGQDTIKLTRTLTVVAGVRWDFEPPRTERFNREVFWDSKYKWDVSLNPVFNWQQDLAEAGVTDNVPEPVWMTKGFYGRPAVMGSTEYPGRTLQNVLPYHFSPHIGIAYQVAPHTVVRASYGLNWMSVIGNRWLNGAMWNNGYGDAINIQTGSSNQGLTYDATFENPTPNGVGYQKESIAGNEQLALNTALGQWYLAQAVDTSEGYEHAFQLAVQQQIGNGTRAWVFEINASGNLGRNLPWALGRGEEILQNAYNLIGKEGTKLLQQVDNPVYGTVPTQYGAWANAGSTTPLGEVYLNNPLFGQAWVNGEGGGTSNYFQGYLQAEHRFGNGYSLLTSYTLSKMMQDTGSLSNWGGSYGGNGTGSYDSNGYPQAGLGLGDIYAVAPNDRTHRFLANFSADLPFGRGRRLLNTPSGMGGEILEQVVGGWTVAGTTTYWSGEPLGISGVNAGFWSGLNQGRGMRAVFNNMNYNNHVSGHTAIYGPNGGTKSYFNTGSFRNPVEQELGNVPALISNLRGPGYSNWDMAALKNIRLWSESSKLQIRAEASNLFNHMDSANPDENIGDGTFGYVTSQLNSPRRMMLAAKITF